jgi:hypothetical protein
MNSIVQSEKECFFTYRMDWLEKHHIFGGANRKNSEKYGLWVWLNHYWHNEPPEGVHYNRARMDELRRIGQQAFQERFPDKDFRKIFGQNYL